MAMKRKVNYWRMAFREGSQGPDLWKYCLIKGIAAIGYSDKNDVQIVGDCRKFTIEEFDEIWKKKWPRSGSAKNSLKLFAYEMKEGDIIYAKEGPLIVGKGVVGKYGYEPQLFNEYGHKGWNHFRNVEWDLSFKPFRTVLGADQCAVLKLNQDRLDSIRQIESKEHGNNSMMEVKEGKRFVSEAMFRVRNQALIDLKKRRSDYRCEVCNMKFKDVYGDIGSEYIVAHHVKTIGSRKKASKSTLDDISLVCANCHDMLHTKDPPYSIKELRRHYQECQ